VSILLLFAVRRVLHWALDRTLYRLAPKSTQFPGSHEKTSAGNPVMKPHRYARFLMALSLLALTAVFFMHAAKRSSQRGSPSLHSRNRLAHAAESTTPFLRTFAKYLATAISSGALPDPNGAPDVDLFVAYFASQRAGDTLHSPKNCLPAMAGFRFDLASKNQRSRRCSVSGQ